MRVEPKASLVLAGLMALLSVLIQLTGLNAEFPAGQIVFLVASIGINIGVVYWALKQTAATSRYRAQLFRAAAIGVIAGFLIVIVSWALLGFVFPDSLDETRQAALAYMEARDFPADELERQSEMLRNTTPMSQSVPGGIGTFVTSVLAGAIVAIFARQK